MLDHVLYDTISLLTVILLLVVVEGAWWVADLPLAGLRRLIGERYNQVPQSQRVIIRTVCMWAALTLPMVPATAQMDTRHAIGLQSWALLVALLEQVVAPLTFVRHWPITIIWTAMRVIQILTFATVMLMP